MFKQQGRLVNVPSAEEWEFEQVERVRQDVAALVCHETIGLKLRDLLDKEKYEIVSIEDTKAKVREEAKDKDGEGDDEEKAVSDTEV